MSSEFLSELHWEDGFAIPVANQENKMLEDQVRRTGCELGHGPAGEEQLRNSLRRDNQMRTSGRLDDQVKTG